jgi:hypothetical protein
MLEDLKNKIGEFLFIEVERNQFWIKLREKIEKSAFFGEKNVFYENEQETIRILRAEELEEGKKRNEERKREEVEIKR